MKIKIPVFSLSLDGPKCGTVAGAFATEREACTHLVNHYNAGITNEALRSLIAGGYFDALENLLQDQGDGLTAWQIDESTIEIEVPLVDKLVAALGSTLPVLQDFHEREGCAETLRQVKAALAKAVAGSSTLDQTPRLLAALLRLLKCPDLNFEKLEPETVAAIEQAQAAIAM